MIPAIAAAPNSPETLHILFVEDEEDDVVLALRALRKGGIDPQWQRVETPQALRTALTEGSWDVVISDYHMPHLEAPQAFEIAQAQHPDLPFIVISGTIGEDIAVALMRAGIHDYLMKDRLMRLPEAVRREVRDARLRQQQRQAEMVLALTQERLQMAIAGSNLGTWDWYFQTGALVVNTRCLEMVGAGPTDAPPIHVNEWRRYIHPADLPATIRALNHHIQHHTPQYECEFRLRHRQGHWVWVLDRGRVVEWAEAQTPRRIAGTLLDISDRKHTEARLSLQTAILAQIAEGQPLDDILHSLTHTIEADLGEGYASILLRDAEANCLNLGVAPSLPPSYLAHLYGIPIGPQEGSCGTAAFRKETVVVADIATDPLWAHIRDVPLAHQLRACWSVPVLDQSGAVLATFAIYYSTCRVPQPQEQETVVLAANLIKVAIERHRSAQALLRLNQDLEQRAQERAMALQMSEAKFRSVLDNAPSVVYVKTFQCRYTLVNRAFCELLNCREADILGQGNYDIFPPDVAATLEANDRLVLSSGQFLQVEEEIRLGDQVKTFLSNKFLLRDGEGRPYALCGISTDITDRHEIQKALERSERQAKATLQAIPDLLMRVNRQRQYLDIIPAAKTRCVVDPETAIGRSMDELLLPEVVARFQHTIAQALDQQTLVSFEQHLEFDGHIQYEEVRLAPCGNDEVIISIRDISDRRHAEIELQQNEEKYRNLVENANVIIYTLSPEGVFTYVSSTWSAILGHDLSEVLHQPFQPFVHPEDVDRCTAFLNTALIQGDAPDAVLEYRMRHQDGTWRWHSSTGAPQYDADGHACGFIGVAQDITDRKQAELQLQRTNAQLARATRLKDEFLANMSHELRTPLNAVLGLTEGLQEEVFGPLTPRQTKALTTIETSGRHLLALINDILDLSKIEAGKLTLQREWVPLKSLCTTSLSFVQQLAHKKHVNLRLDLPAQLAHSQLWVDDRRWRQVLINLLSNAVKFTPDGGEVTLAIAPGPPDRATDDIDDIKEPTSGEAVGDRQDVTFAVVDTGIGIAGEDLERIFESFTQIDSRLSRRYEGTGLGLTLVKDIVTLHGGSVAVESQVGQGSRFGLTLPQALRLTPGLPTLNTHAPDRLPAVAERSGATVLIVEDNPANIDTIGDYLAVKGYRVLMAAEGREGITLAQQHRPDLILMDIQMPGMDGLEAIRHIRQDPHIAAIPIIALTALALPSDRDRCLAAGADDYLAKPVRLKQLISSIYALLKQRVNAPSS